MDRRDFATPKALYDYAEQTGNVYLWEGMLAFAKRLRVLSPEQYQIVDVRTSRGMRRAMLFSKAILQAEWEADAPMREAMAIKRARLEAKRVEKARRAAEWEAEQARRAAERQHAAERRAEQRQRAAEWRAERQQL
jgi:hypothetical protein